MMMTTSNDNKQLEDVGESTVGDVKSPSIGNLEGSLSRLDEIFQKDTNGAKDIDKDLVSVSSNSVSRRLSDRLAGRVSKFNANPTDGSFLSPMQSTLKKKVRNATIRPLQFSPEPRRLHPTKTLENRIKTFDGSSSKSNFVKIDLRSPQDIKKLVESSRDNQRLGEILSRYEKLAGGDAQQRRELAYKMAARDRHRRHGSTVMSDEERARLLRQNRARLYRSGSERILEDVSPEVDAGDDGMVCDNVWAVQCDFSNFVPPSYQKTKMQRNLILGVIQRSFVFAEFRNYGRARCDGAIEMLVDAFESVGFPSGHILLHSGMRKENDSFYLVERGRIDFKIDERPVAQIDEVGGYFGELALLHSAVSERTVSVHGSSDREVRLLKINQNTFRGILNTCSKQAAQEKREALLSVDFLSEIIEENEKMIRQLSSIMIREEMILDGYFNLSQNNTFVVIRLGRMRVSNSDEIFDSGDHFGSRALIQTLPRPNQNDIDVVACSEHVVFFRIENHAMGQIVGQKRLQNLMDMRRFATTGLIEKSNLSSDAHELMADTIAEKKIGDEEDTWEVDKNDPPAVYIVREGSLNVSTHDKATGNQIETLVTAGNIFGLDQLKMSTKNGRPTYRRCGGLKASIPNGESTSIGVLPLNEVKPPSKASSISSAFSNECHIDPRDTEEASDFEGDNSASSVLQLRARVQEAVESKISFQDLEKIRLLGEGEFGEVWLVAADVLRDKSITTRQKFALKTQLIEDDSRGMDATDVILREINIMTELNHPQVVDLVTTYQDETSIHMLMRVVPYGELWDRMHIEDNQGNWSSGVPDDHAKFYAISIADTLNFIHSRGIIYRDLKPENVLIDVDGYPVIVDFGCSKFCPDKAYTFVGTPNYVAPEMITNAGHNKGVDIWALGVMVYEMVAGENPFFFDGMDQISLYHSICHEKYFPLTKDKNKECVDFIDKLLKKDPIERLGMLHAGINDILQHQWFDGIDLEQIRAKLFAAPWKPTELVRDGFEDFHLEGKEFAQNNNSSFSINESMKSYVSIVSTEETEVQDLSHSSRSKSEPVQDSMNSFSTGDAGEIQKLSNSSRSKPGDIQFSTDSFSSFVSTEETGEVKDTITSSDLKSGDAQEQSIASSSKSKKTKRKKKPKKLKSTDSKSKESVSSRLGSYSNSYDDPSEFQFISVKHARPMRNPTIRHTMSQKKERRTRRDLLKSSFDNFGID